MSEIQPYQLRFEPIFQYRLWGGRALGDWMSTALPGNDTIGEAWVLSDRADQSSRVVDGPLRGQTLTQLMAQHEAMLLGAQAGRFRRFPLLLKFLDVEQMLSVQVHPRDDQTALIPEGDSGKTEAWVVLEAHDQGRIYAGLKPGTTAEDLRALTTGTADVHLASFKPTVGQAVLIQAGTVHSLGDGVMVFEVQENSDVTFRLYDWDHVDAKTGKPRDLQVDQALQCVDLRQGAIAPVTPTVRTTAPVRREGVFDTAHFRLERLQGEQPFAVGAPGEARVLVCVEGSGRVQDTAMDRGAVVLLPAALGECRFEPDGPVTLLHIAIPDPQ